MSDSDRLFDVYVQWLGIRDAERPPNHYRLLGLEPFEPDPDVIANAADRQMAHVRRFQNGPRSEMSQRLLNELAAAKVCLLRPELKADYDERLRHVAAQRLAAAVVATATSQDWRERDRRVHRRRRNLVLSILASLAIVVAGVTVILRGLSSDHRPRNLADAGSVPEPVADDVPPGPFPSETVDHRPENGTLIGPSSPQLADEPAPDERTTADRVASDSSDPTGTESFGPVAEVKTVTPETASPERPAESMEGWYPAADESIREEPPPVADAGSLAAMSPLQKANNLERYRQTGERRGGAGAERARPAAAGPAGQVALTGAQKAARGKMGTFERLRAALRSRDLDVARDLLGQLADEATSFTQRDAADRLQVLIDQLERFWDAVASGQRVLQSGQELRLNQQPVEIIRVDRKELVIRTADGKDETISLERLEIPAGWAIMLASLDFSRHGGTANPLVAAFLSVDRDGDPAMAAALWRDVLRRGGAIPVPLPDEP